MSFLKKHKLTVALVAVLGLSAGAFHFTTGGCPLAGSEDCLLGSIFSATTAYAGVGCSKTCDSDAKATTAAAKSTDASHCTKESCVKAIMAEKKVSQVEAEAIYAKMVSEGSCSGAAKQASFASSSGCSASKASVETASASGCSASKASTQTVSASGCSGHSASAQTASASGCSGSAKTTASFANATESKTCGDKEACIAKCMAEKGLTRAEAEACYEKCQAAKATQANVIEGSGFTRESWIDAKVASGMTRSDAEVAAAKAEASGDVKFITASASGCSATKVSATGSSCCASKASANTAAKVEETTPATATTVSTGGTK